jgi:hypothetical protein
MESFTSYVGPIAVALVGFVIFWGIAKAVSSRKDPDSESETKSE